MLALIGITAFLAVTLLAIAFARGISASRSRMKDRITLLASDGVVPATRTDGRMLRLQNYSSMPFVQRLLQGTASAERIADELDRAAIPLRVGELLSLGLLAAVLAGIAVFALLPSSPWQVVAMIAAMALGFLIPRWIVRRRMVRRRTQFEAQLPDGLDILSRSLRTGNGLLVSIDAIVEQIPGVIGDEFSRMRQEMAAGLSVEDAMRELDRRLESPDLHIVVTAILVQREVGGNLAEILDNVAKTMRERVSLRRELHAITSQERFSTYIVALVPPVILLMLGLINPDIISSMLSQTAGWIVLGAAAGLELCGIIVLRALVGSFEV